MEHTFWATHCVNCYVIMGKSLNISCFIPRLSKMQKELSHAMKISIMALNYSKLVQP